MNLLSDPLFLSIAVPFVAALIVAFGRLPAAGTKLVAALGFLAPALIALYLWCQFPADIAGRYTYLTRYDTGLQSLGITLALGLNGVSLPLYVLAAIVGLAAGLYAIQAQVERSNVYLALLLLMQSGLMGVFASVDVFFLYIFHEIALIPTFIMIGLWGGRDRSYAAMKMTIYLTFGAMLSLLGLIAIYVKGGGGGNFDLISLRTELAMHPLSVMLQKNIFGLLLIGFGTLVSLWPFHTWAPAGYGAAPSSAAMLHAGVLKKFGLYALLQIALPLLPLGGRYVHHLSTAWIPNFLLPHAWEAAIPFTWIGLMAGLAVVGNLVVVGLITMAQRDLKQLVGYSSVMHMGYAFLGLACGTAMGAGGAILMMVGHGLSVALLFLLSTSIFHRTQTFSLDAMGGLARKTPVLAAFFVAATFASIGLPGFANFWGELTIFVAAWQYSHLLTVLAVSGVVISAVYGLRAAAAVFFGPETEPMARVTVAGAPADLSLGEKIPALILLVALLGLGFWPRALTTPLNAALISAGPAEPAAASPEPAERVAPAIPAATAPAVPAAK